MGVRLKSKAPFMWASAESCGLVFELRRRLRVVVACCTRRSQRWSGKAGLALVRPARKWSFHVPMAFSAGLDRWSWGGTNWYVILFLVINVARLGGHSLSRNSTLGVWPRATRWS